MVKQGDIIKTNFNPQSGHEQAGYRPAVVISNSVFNSKTNLVIVCPITNTKRPFALHIPLDNRTETAGVILCEHVTSLDIGARGHKFIEKLPKDLLNEAIDTVKAEIDII